MAALEHAAVPHLTTALTGPLLQLERHFLDKQATIERWFRDQWRATPAPFYCSVDLRNAGFKLAPVDTNLFPAGFNNLNPAFLTLCIQAVQTAIERVCPTAGKVLLVPESHTRNLHYLDNIATFVDIVAKAGYEIRVGSLLPDLAAAQKIELPSGRHIVLEPVIREGRLVSVGDYEPCVVLLNNDLSTGRPPILENIEQPIVPPMELGWWRRLKSVHFNCYRDVSAEFAALVDIDPWLVDPLFRNCGEIDFMKREGEDCMARNTDTLLKAVQLKYDEYKLDRKPFVVVKADAGTYGMSVMMVHSPDEIFELNRKQRTKMAASKGGQAVSKVIVQEGVYTFETWDGAVTEPVVYMIDHFVVGGFYRVHKERGVSENLNAPGMHFEPLAFAEPCNAPDSTQAPDAHINRFYAYGVVARLALVAAAREIAVYK
ncbi:MAG: glutamate--cysteine ligase [Gammaproteobacteria bacterium]|nr:glutamate--cysteine ligase [Gammaproteobacteria bacterium]